MKCENDDNVVRALWAAIDRELQKNPGKYKSHSQCTPACLSFPRLREIALRGYESDEQAKSHVAKCAYCKKYLLLMKKELWHPDAATILQTYTGECQGEIAQYVRLHLEIDRCEKCIALCKKYDILIKPEPHFAADAPISAPKQVFGFVVEGIPARAPMLAAAAQGQEKSPTLTIKKYLLPKNLTLTARIEDETGATVLSFETKDPAHGKAVVIFSVWDPKQRKSIHRDEVVLENRDNIYVGRKVLPSTLTMGPNCILIAVVGPYQKT